MSFTWPEHHVLQFLKFAKKSLEGSPAIQLERSLREGTGTEYLLNNDPVGACLDEIWGSKEIFCQVITRAIEASADSYERILARGRAEALAVSNKIDEMIAVRSWQEALKNAMKKQAIGMLQQKCVEKALDGSLCALSGL
ncbi:hypothetical protein BdWA1_000130 [Babesia duncani]|uniref:Uncharacterized protein n=1 Tax=Babesia duncani TaxID=323732 RepID=A0AAD9PLL0_9APIC|nr:hypothetical protein BdWA1_000130 [Babesia duncani]